MSLTSRDTKVIYHPDGTETVFEVPFPIFSRDGLECLSVDAEGGEATLSNFSVSGFGTSLVQVVFATPPEAGKSLVIRRSTAPVTDSKYPESGKFPSKRVEGDFDKVFGILQEHAEMLERAPLAPSDDGEAQYEMSVVRPGKKGLAPAGGYPGAVMTFPDADNEAVYTSLVGVPASQEHVMTGLEDTPNRHEFMGPGRHAYSHRVTEHLYLASDDFVPDEDGYIEALTLADGGKNGGRGSGDPNTTSGQLGGIGGASGKILVLPNHIPVKKGISYRITVAGPTGLSDAFGYSTGYGGFSVNGGTTGRITPASGGGFSVYNGQPGSSLTVGWGYSLAPGAGGASSASGALPSGGGGGAGGCYLPGMDEATIYTKAANGGGPANAAGKAGPGLSAGGGGGASENFTYHSGGTGAQGGVWFRFRRQPGGVN